MKRYIFYKDPMSECFCEMEENEQGQYVEYEGIKDSLCTVIGACLDLQLLDMRKKLVDWAMEQTYGVDFDMLVDWLDENWPISE